MVRKTAEEAFAAAGRQAGRGGPGDKKRAPGDTMGMISKKNECASGS